VEGSSLQDNPGIVVQDGSALVNDANISDDVVTDNATLDDLSTEYNLKDINISEYPEGTPVLKFDSVEDLNKFLATEDAAPKTIETTINNTEPLPVSKLGLSQPLALRSSNYTTVRKTKTVNTGFANVNLGLAERIKFGQIQAKFRLSKYKIVLCKNFKKRTLSLRSRFSMRN
ncbi:hypothetical protein P9709_03400, partial [Heyndrickxia coagulans]|nr:hypothetical protein [Heyndrickxia coagulans]